MLLHRALKLLLLAAAAYSIPLWAAEITLQFTPAQTKIQWSLDATLHTVHGTFQLRSGALRFDAASGKASGEFIVDATSGQSGNDSRDSKMHKSVLESARFSSTTFRPDRIDGQVPTNGKASIKLHGALELHGSAHEFTLPVDIDVQSDRIAATSHFEIPYVAWGLKNPSTFVLRVSGRVAVDIQATGLLQNAGAR